MSIWSKIFSSSSKLDNPAIPISEAVDDIFGVHSAKGPTDLKGALSVSAAYSCMRVIAETLGSLKVELLEVDGKTINPAKDHPLYHIVTRQPHQSYTANTFYETGTLHISGPGNFYAKINRNQSSGRVESLTMFKDNEVTVFYENEKLFYKVNGQPYNSSEILHVKGLSLDGLTGISPIKYNCTAIGSIKSATEMVHNTAENMAYVGGVLTTEKALSKEGRDRIVTSWRKNFGGRKKAGGTPLLEEGLKYQPVRLSPTDMQLIQLMEYGVRDIARIWRVPLHLIGSLERSTNNNIEQQAIDFVQHTIRPYVKRWEAELNSKLLLDSEKSRYKIRFNLDSLLRGDTKARAEYYRTMFMIGSLNQDEIRALENMNPLPNGAGQKYYVMTNMADSATNKQVGNE